MTWNQAVLNAIFVVVFGMTVVWAPVLAYQVSVWFVLFIPAGIVFMAFLGWYMLRVDRTREAV